MEWEDCPCDVCGGDQEGDGVADGGRRWWWEWECNGGGVGWWGAGPSETAECDAGFDVGEEEGGGWAGGEWDEDEDGLSQRGAEEKSDDFCHDNLIGTFINHHSSDLLLRKSDSFCRTAASYAFMYLAR